MFKKEEPNQNRKNVIAKKIKQSNFNNQNQNQNNKMSKIPTNNDVSNDFQCNQVPSSSNTEIIINNDRITNETISNLKDEKEKVDLNQDISTTNEDVQMSTTILKVGCKSFIKTNINDNNVIFIDEYGVYNPLKEENDYDYSIQNENIKLDYYNQLSAMGQQGNSPIINKETNSYQTKSTNTSISRISDIQLSSSTDSELDFGFWNVFHSNVSSSNSFTESLPVNHSFSSTPISNVPEKCSSQQSSTNEKSNHNCTSMQNTMNFLKQYISTSNVDIKNNYLSNCNVVNSMAYNSKSSNCHATHYPHHYYHNHFKQIVPLLFEQQLFIENPMKINNNKANSLEMTPIEATKIISNYCNENSNTNVNSNSSAITTLTSSSSGLPVTTLTAMESPKLSSNRSHNWQAYMPTLKDRLATIFNRDILADVYFIVGKKAKTRFAAHKFILSIGSAVFDTMFNGLLAKVADSGIKKDGSDSIASEIELPDIEPEAFEALLRFLYLDEVDIGPETVVATLYAAKKYEVLSLEVACVNFLKANLNPENAFMLLTQARLFDETSLADLCLETIDKHTIDAIQSDYFLEIDIETLKMVLSRDSLRVREATLFTAVLKWTESECIRRNLEINSENKRKTLMDALYLIRFPLMTIGEFALYAAQSGLLTDKEIVNIFLYYTVNSKCSIPFSFVPRCCITGEEYSVNRFQRTEKRWGYSGTSDRIRFLTDRPIFVIGFGLYGSILDQAEYEVIIEVIHTGSGKVIASNSTTFTSDGSDSTFKVMFQYPVEISQNTSYTARATLKGVDSYYGTNGCRTLTVNLGKNNNKNSVTFQFSYAAGCNNGTSVEDGQIPEIIFYV